MLDLFYFITSGEGDLFYFLFLFLFQGRIVQCYKLLIFYSSLTIVEFTSENDCPIIIKPRKKMNYNFISTFFLFLINVCVFSFFFLKVAERYLGHVTKSPIIYIYIYIYFFFYNKPIFIKNNKIEIVQPRASSMVTYIIRSSKATIYKTIPIC